MTANNFNGLSTHQILTGKLRGMSRSKLSSLSVRMFRLYSTVKAILQYHFLYLQVQSWLLPSEVLWQHFLGKDLSVNSIFQNVNHANWRHANVMLSFFVCFFLAKTTVIKRWFCVTFWIFFSTNLFLFTVYASFYSFPFCLNFMTIIKLAVIICAQKMLEASVTSIQVYTFYSITFHIISILRSI